MINASIAAPDLGKDGSSPGTRSRPAAGRSAGANYRAGTRVARIEHLKGTLMAAPLRHNAQHRSIGDSNTFWARSRRESHFGSHFVS